MAARDVVTRGIGPQGSIYYFISGGLGDYIVDPSAWSEAVMILLIENDAAETVLSNYVHCDRSNWRVYPGGLKKEYTGMMVRPDLHELRHPQEYERSRGGDKSPGSPRPEQEDTFITDEITIDDF